MMKSSRLGTIFEKVYMAVFVLSIGISFFVSSVEGSYSPDDLCSSVCDCQGSGATEDMFVHCSRKNLTHIPNHIPQQVTLV